MRRNSTNFAMVLGAKFQLGQLRPMIIELANNWGDSEVVYLTAKERANGDGKIIDFAFTFHCVKDGEVELIANLNYFKMGPISDNKDITLIRYKSLNECLDAISNFEETAEYWGDCLYNVVF